MIIDNILSTNTIREKAALYFPSHGINEQADDADMDDADADVREIRKFDRSVIVFGGRWGGQESRG